MSGLFGCHFNGVPRQNSAVTESAVTEVTNSHVFKGAFPVSLPVCKGGAPNDINQTAWKEKGARPDAIPFLVDQNGALRRFQSPD